MTKDAGGYPLAEYVDGAIKVYDLDGRHDRLESELIASHEQFHHLLRRKSSFGMYLTELLRRATTAVPQPRSFELQALASRYRTSDEAFATYASIRMGSWHYGLEPILKVLARYPTYSTYYRVAESLFDPAAPPLLAATALEAVVRFCWSPKALRDFQSVSVADLYRQLSPEQFPDKRFDALRKGWSQSTWHDLAAAMTSAIPGVEQALTMPYAALLDPFYDVKRQAEANNWLFVSAADSERFRSAEVSKNRELLNQLGAALSGVAYDHLVDRFRDTSLASLERTALTELMLEQTSAAVHDRGVAPRETLYVRTSRRRVALSEESFQPWPYCVSMENEWIAPVFVRSYEDLSKHLALDATGAAGAAQDQAVVYSLHAGHDISLDPLSVQALFRDWDQVAPLLAETQKAGPVIIWTADALEGRVDIRSIALHAPVWCVCNTDPRLTVEWLRGFISELAAYSSESQVPGSAVRGMIVYALEEQSPIEGIVFPGTTSMINPIGSLLYAVFGDSCRGVDAKGPMIRRSSIVRSALGQFILDFISITDSWFSMA